MLFIVTDVTNFSVIAKVYRSSYYRIALPSFFQQINLFLDAVNVA